MNELIALAILIAAFALIVAFALAIGNRVQGESWAKDNPWALPAAMAAGVVGALVFAFFGPIGFPIMVAAWSIAL